MTDQVTMCEVCDNEMDSNYPYSVCPGCCEILRRAIKEPAYAIIDEDGIHVIQ